MESPLHQPAAGPPPRTGEEPGIADPERALAITYAPAAARPALTALFALDERFGAIVAATHEPTIGLIRLAWWREALERLDAAAPPAEPLLAALTRDVAPYAISGASLAETEDGWAALLEDGEPAALAARHAGRGAHLFAAAARILGASDARIGEAGRGWALADLAHRHSSSPVQHEARRQAHDLFLDLKLVGWPSAARPLAALATLARRDANAATRRQGSPSRVARMLAVRLFGR